jgi:hypothetical protein
MSPSTAELNNIANGVQTGLTFAAAGPLYQELLLYTWETLLYANVSPAIATPAQSLAAWNYTVPLVVSPYPQTTPPTYFISNQPAWIAGAPAAVPGGSKPAVTPNIISTPPPAPGAAPTTPTTPTTPTSPPATSPTSPTSPPPALPQTDNPFAPGNYCDMYPDDPLCTSVLYEGLPPNIIFLDTPTTTIEGGISITIDGAPGADVTAAVDGALGDLWDATVGAVDNVVADAVNAIQQVLTEIGNALKAAWNILSHLAGLILGFLQQLLTDVVKGIVNVLKEASQLAQDLYKKVLLPIAQAATKIRDALIDVYQRFIRPMLIVLQDLRKVLSILAAFHVAFARKLDQKLAELESRITAPLLYLLSYVNAVSNWINLIISAGYLLQKSVFLNSLAAYIGEALNLQLNAMNQQPSSGAIAAAAAANTVPTAAQASADLVNFVGDGAGPLPAGMQPYADQFTGYLAQGPI